MATAHTVPAGAAPDVRRATFAAQWRRDHWFFTVLPAAMFVAVFIGFARTYYLKGLFDTPVLPWLYHVHGAAFTAWMVLMIVQPALVLARRVPLHRRAGWFAAGLVPVMAVLAWFVAVDMGRRGAAPPGVPPLVFMVVPMASVVVFPAFVGAALWWRRVPETHKRLMLIATLELVPAGIARWPVLQSLGPLAFFGGSDLFVVAMAAYDVSRRGRIHPATVWGGALLIGSQVGRFVVTATPAWQSFAVWVTS